jgi:hypothetical protein
MIRIPKSLVSFGAFILAAGALMLAIPPAARAVTAALVQDNNPPANPANTEDTSKQANQLVQLYCATDAVGDLVNCSLVTSLAAYAVPAPQSLVITTVDVRSLVGFTGSNQLLLYPSQPGVTNDVWAFSGGDTVEYRYPSGIVFPSGSDVQVSSLQSVEVYMTGYLTMN